VAHSAPPAAFQAKNVPYGMRAHPGEPRNQDPQSGSMHAACRCLLAATKDPRRVSRDGRLRLVHAMLAVLVSEAVGMVLQALLLAQVTQPREGLSVRW